MAIDDIRRVFRRLPASALETSPQDDSYNCIAWAAGDTDRFWWPGAFPTHGTYWPLDSEDATIDAFVEAFRTRGYEACEDGTLEYGYEKVALYADFDGDPLHMARQLSSGAWTSKMGRAEDIQHQASSELGGGPYGEVATYMKRPT